MVHREILWRRAVSKTFGFEIADSEIHPILKYHQRLSVIWGARGGRRAWFSQFGLGKTLQQLETVRLMIKHYWAKIQKPGLIVAPLGVRQEFMHDAGMVGIDLKFIRRWEEVDLQSGIYITNYETVRDGKLDPSQFGVTSLDECDVLRGFGGTKTFREFMRLFEPVPYRFLATATPDPNEYIELLAYAAYLGIMDVSAAKTRFFKRDSTKADKLTIHPHKVEEFWLWVASWALFLNKPSDIGGSDEGYELPPMEVIYHEIRAGERETTAERDGQYKMYRDASLGVVDAAREKRDSIGERIETLRTIIQPVHKVIGEQFIVWCDLNREQEAIDEALDSLGISYSSLYGTGMDLEERERLLEEWRFGNTQAFVSKPMMYGAGVNLQQCHIAVFLGIGFKFRDFLQAIARIHRFLQQYPVQIHLVYTDNEREVLRILLEKWERHKKQVAKMAEIIREYGLSELALATAMCRSLGVDRVEVSGKDYRLIQNDCVEEVRRLESASVHLILSSIPFGTMYEYSPNYNDFGHTDNGEHFFEQMDFLVPDLLRVLKPALFDAVEAETADAS